MCSLLGCPPLDMGFVKVHDLHELATSLEIAGGPQGVLSREVPHFVDVFALLRCSLLGSARLGSASLG